MKDNNNVVLSVEGYTNDLLQISKAHNMKRTSLVYFNPISKEIGEEVVTVSIDSDNESLTFPIFDKMVNKKIKITVETIDEDEKANDICSKKDEQIEFVDLGLTSGTKWMRYNIGATKETDYGLYFQWGDTVGYSGDDAKEHSTWDTCPGNGEKSSCDSTSFATWKSENLTDGVLNTSVDAAYVHTSGKAKMPTQGQLRELINGTDKEWTTIDGVNGWKFTSKKDSSKYIFIPAAGYVNNGKFNIVGNNGYVWSSSLNTSNESYAYGLYFYSGDVYVSSRSSRYLGVSVRGVAID